MKDQIVTRDERTTAVENASYRWGYLVLSFGLLVIATYRALAWNETTWDLLALVILGGLLTTFNQGIHGILTRRWGMLAFVTALVAAGAAVVVSFLR